MTIGRRKAEKEKYKFNMKKFLKIYFRNIINLFLNKETRIGIFIIKRMWRF